MYNFLFYVIFVKSALSFLSFYEAFFLTWKWIFLWIFVIVQFMIGICTRTPFFIAKMVMPTSHKLFYSGIYKISPWKFPHKNWFIQKLLFSGRYMIHSYVHFIKIPCLFHLHENLLKSYVYKKNKGLSNQIRLLHWWWYYLLNQYN